jgi:glycosyltransferase involved in cell wall biosynthesis
MLCLHARQDAEFGWESTMLIGCETTASCGAHGAIGLGVRGWNNTATLRRRFSKFYHAFAPEVFICHNLWAGRHILPLVLNSFRVGMIHTASEETWIALNHCRNDLDLVIAVSPQIAEQARRIVGENVMIRTIDYAITPPPPPIRNRKEGTPFIAGYCGRLTVEQKRCDRLVKLMAEALKLDNTIRFEVMGDGAYTETLQQSFGGNSQVAILGRKSGAEYWNRLQAWDAIVSTSDYEGTPIALLEALSQGVLPLYPRIDSGGDAYVAQIDPSLLYEKEDVTKAAKRLVLLSQTSEVALAPLRYQAIDLTLKNRPEKYLESFFASVEAGLAAPRHSNLFSSPSRTASWKDYVPFFLVRRLMPRWVY